MIPTFLFPSYKQYKTDTDAVATWLANTAARYGYSTAQLTSQAAFQPKSSRLKGKARKIARQATPNTSSGSRLEDALPKTPKYSISSKEFISLAEWIVKSFPPRVEIPARFFSVLDRAITVRKRHHQWWYSHSEKGGGKKKEEEQADKNHRHFIDTLEKVREILQPKSSTALSKDSLVHLDEATGASEESTNDHLVNLFENLEIEEPADIFLSSDPNALVPRPASTSHAQYVLRRASELDEVYFAVHCLFNDLDNVRRYLKKVWEGYKQGTFDLVAVSIITNTAIDFARRLHEDFNGAFPEHTDFEKHVNVLYRLICLKSDQDPKFKERPDDDFNFAVYEDIGTILFPTYALLSSFKDIIVPGELPLYRAGAYGLYDPSSDRASQSSREKFRDDKVVLLEILPEFCVLALGAGSIPAEDELTRGIRGMVENNELLIWLAFAAQIFLDIHHTLRGQVSRGFDDLVRSAKYVEANTQQVMKFHAKLHIKNWPKTNDQGLLDILALVNEWTKSDAVLGVRTRLTGEYGVQFAPEKSFLLLKHHPWYCGLLSYCIKASVQEISIAFVNAWGSVLYSAHLYNALRQENLLSNLWQDMDLALLMHRTQNMFIGDFPKTVDDYFKRFALAMGYSITMFAKSRRQTGVVESKLGPRKLDEVNPICRMFKSRYCHGEAFVNFSPDDIDTILTKHTSNNDDTNSKDAIELPSSQIKVDIPPPTSPTKQSDSGSQNRPRKTQRTARSGVRPIQLLNALLDAIQSEMLELTFNHFRLHTFSWCLLRKLQEALDDDLRDIYGAGYLEKENQLPFVVGYIFMAASASSARLADVLKAKQRDIVTNRLLVKAATVVKEMLETGTGGIEAGMLKQLFGFDVQTPDFMVLAGSRSVPDASGAEGPEE